MKARRLLTLCVFLMLLVFINEANCYPEEIQYKIEILLDGSAVCTVTQVTDLNASVDTQDAFQQKVENFVNAASIQASREMTVNPNSLQMDIAISWESQSKTIVYTFTWSNFSVLDNGEISFGDVFQVTDFFGQLYGDGDLLVVYPDSCSVVAVSPAPNFQDDGQHTLEWLRTQDFVNGKHRIILTANSATSSTSLTTSSPLSTESLWTSGELVWIVASSGLAIAFVLVVGRVIFKRRKHRNPENRLENVPIITFQTEGDEEKILKVVRSSGGKANQSLIVEQCKFSKAKTSQLLSVLEKKGAVRRYKKGRDKIVILTLPGEVS